MQPSRPLELLPKYARGVGSQSYLASCPRAEVTHFWPGAEIGRGSTAIIESCGYKPSPSGPRDSAQAGSVADELPSHIYIDDWIEVWETRAEEEAAPCSHHATNQELYSWSSDQPHLEGAVITNRTLTEQEKAAVKSHPVEGWMSKMEKVRHTEISRAEFPRQKCPQPLELVPVTV